MNRPLHNLFRTFQIFGTPSNILRHVQPKRCDSTYIFKYQVLNRSYATPSGIPGAGAGKGGGAGGSIRESGGGLGKYGAAQEEGYFYNKQRQQLEKIKQKQKSEPKKSDDSHKEEKP